MNSIIFIRSLFFIALFLNINLNAQVVRSWDYSFNPPGNLEAAGNCILHLGQGLTVTGGNFKNTSNPNRKNIL